MGKLQMCRLCLVENVRMFEVVDKNLHQLYEKLTDIAFVTEDSRPMLACFLCYVKLKQCCQFQRKCVEAEELLAQMLNEPNLFTNRDQLQLFSGLMKSQMEIISIVNFAQNQSSFIKEELPAVGERLDNIMEPNKEDQSDDQELENVHNGYSEEQIPAHSESDSDELPLIVLKHEEEQEVPSKIRSEASVTKRVPVVILEKLQLDTRRTKPEDIITEEQKKNEQSHAKVVPTTQNTCKEPLTHTQPRVNNSISNTTLETNCSNNSNKNDIQHEISNKSVVNDNVNMHQTLCVKEKRFICDICQHRFTRKNDLKYHITRFHSGDTGKTYKCDICQRCFGHKDKLKRHIRLHTCENPYMCAICERCFPFKSILINHIRTHTGEKLYKCDICQSKFSTKFTLARHTNTHTGVKPYECEICRRAFSTKFVLKEHVRTHTSEKLYHCAICERGFNQKYNLSAHIRMHTGVKPFKCEICQYSCSDKRNLGKHVTSKHANGKL